MAKLGRTLWMVLALTALPLAARAQNLSEEPQFDRPGGDYTNFRTTDLRECKRACATDRRCAAYSFNSVNSACYLKDQITKTNRDSRTISGVKEGYSPGPGPGGGDRFLSEERGSDYRGGDYTNFRSRGLGDCQDACRGDRRCQAYTFNGRTGVCHLKDRVGDRERNGETVTGHKGRRDDDGPGRPPHGGGDLSREPGFDYYGGDYTNFRVPGDDACREECRRDRRCAAYSFNTRSGMCYLKEEAGPLRRNADTVTGVKRRR